MNALVNTATKLTYQQMTALEPIEVFFTDDSTNRKIGHIAASYTEKGSCPDACPLKAGGGCYAEGYPVAFHWNNIGKPNKKGKMNPKHHSWTDFLNRLRAVPEFHYSSRKKKLERKLFRHNVAGDLPGDNNYIDAGKLMGLVEATSHLRAFTFTHKPVGFGDVGESTESLINRARNSHLIKEANRMGFAINLSSNNLKEADYLSSLKIGPVVTLVPSDAPKQMKTPEGRHVIVCPNEDNRYDKENPDKMYIQCEHCGLCAKNDRKFIIAFRAHGNKKNKVNKNINKVMEDDGKTHLSVLN